MDPAQEKDQGPHEEATAAPAVERQASRDDMGDSYGTGYATRSSDEGYGEGYGEAVKKVLEKKAEKEEMERGVAANRDQSADAKVHSEYDRSQGHPVAQKEDSRHFANRNAL